MRFELIVSTALLAGLQASSVQAQEWYTGSNTRTAGDHPSASIDFSLGGTSLGGATGTVIGTIAPFTPMDESGARLRAIGVVGAFKYTSSTPGLGVVNGTQQDGSLLVGYEWVARNTTVDAYIGPEIANTSLSAVDPANKSAGMSYGIKAALDFYSNPTPYSMVSGNLSFSSANSSYYTRFKGGLAISDGLFAGPELMFLGDNISSQIRFGAHLTGLKFGSLQFGVSGGIVSDKGSGKGVYGILDARVLF